MSAVRIFGISSNFIENTEREGIAMGNRGGLASAPARFTESLLQRCD